MQRANSQHKQIVTQGAELFYIYGQYLQGTQIMIDAFSNMPRDVFLAFAVTARVGLFTEEDKTTIFPEYEYYRDRPECEGIVLACL